MTVSKFDYAVLSAVATLIYGPGNALTRALEPLKGTPTLAEHSRALRLLEAIQAREPRQFERLAKFYGQLRTAAAKAAMRTPAGQA